MAILGTPFVVSPELLPALVYIGLVPLGAAFLLWERATHECSLSVLGLLSYLTPPLSTLLLGLAVGRVATVWAWVGLAAVLTGAALGSSKPTALETS
jgi:drug/metabolite transporter (DMT)-like permease